MFNRMNHLIKDMFLNERVYLVIILLFAFTVRLYKINSPLADWHSWRQADTASVSKVYFENGINLLFPRYHDVSSIQSGIFNPRGYRFVEFPIFNAIHVWFAKLLSPINFDAAGRLVSITSALVSVYLVYKLGGRFIGKWGGIFAAFYYAFIPYNIYFTRVILPEPLATTLVLISLWFFVKYYDTSSRYNFLISSIFMTLSILVKPFTIFYMIPIVYLYLKKHGFKEFLYDGRLVINFLVYFSIVVIPFLIWRIWIDKHPEGIPFFKWAFNGDDIRFHPAFFRWLMGERLGRLILGFWGLIPFALGLAWIKKSNKFVHMMFLSVILYVSIVATANIRHDYYQIITIPAITLVMAQGSVYLLKSRELDRLMSIVVLILSVVMMILMGIYQVKEFYKINHPEIVAVGKEVESLTPKDAWIIAPYNGDTAFLYQTGRWGWPEIDDSLDNIIKQGADYYVSVTPDDNNTKMVLSRFQTIKQGEGYVIVDLHKPISK